MHTMVFRMYLASMQDIYDVAGQALLEKTGEDYETALDDLASIRSHMAFTKTFLKEMERM